MSKNARRVRWGILSTANIGRAAVIPAIHAADNGEIVAVASRDAGLARSFAEKNGIRQSYGAYEELLADPKIDAVYIPLPNSMHKEWTIRAVNAGKHVLCEKPLALTADDCREMGAAAEAAGVRLMEAFMYRFHPRTERVLESIREGAIGDLSFVEASFTFRVTKRENIRFSANLGGGALMDVGSYCVNMIRTATGEEPTRVAAFASRTATGVDGRLSGLLSFSSGISAHFDCSLLDERRERYIVAGQDGYIEVEDAFLPGAKDCEIRTVNGRGNEKLEAITGVDEYRLMVEHFGDCVIQGTDPRYGVRDAIHNIRVIEALIRSAAANGEPVDLG